MSTLTSTKVLVVDKNLGNAPPSVSAFSHFGSSGFIAVYLIFRIVHSLPPEQHLGSNAVGTGLPSVNFNIGFDAFWIASQEGIEKVKHFLKIADFIYCIKPKTITVP